MGIFGRLFGQGDDDRAREPQAVARHQQAGDSADERAIARYRYMIRTAPPEDIEQAHEEAFARLTPAQRQQVLADLTAAAPAGEQRAMAGAGDDPRTLARLATRAEMRQPGTMERTFGGAGGGMGMGGMMAGTIFSSLVAGFVGSMVANAFFASLPDQTLADEGLGGEGIEELGSGSDGRGAGTETTEVQGGEYLDDSATTNADFGDDMGDMGDF